MLRTDLKYKQTKKEKKNKKEISRAKEKLTDSRFQLGLSSPLPAHSPIELQELLEASSFLQRIFFTKVTRRDST